MAPRRLGERIEHARIVVGGEHELRTERDDPANRGVGVALDRDVVGTVRAVTARENPVQKHVLVGPSRDVRERLVAIGAGDGFEQGRYVSGCTNAGFVVGARLPPAGSTLTATAVVCAASSGSGTSVVPVPVGVNVRLGDIAARPLGSVHAW